MTGGAAESREGLRVEVDREVCIGAGMCALTAPEVFTQDDDGLSELLPSWTAARQEHRVREAVRLCPVRAITVTGRAP
ncbi:ferredoxin [Streptomyces sp. NPDC001985]|uniref:ferredoxin n=1 Tax=Streptomyces sp. NPDC001985 TaxID=3154406 RepID=UPI00331FAB2A